MEILSEDPKYMTRREALKLREKGYNAAKKIYGNEWRDHVPERDICIRIFSFEYVMTPREHLLLERLIRQAESY